MTENSTERPGRVRVRFAPSPTGELHVGGARTALFNWLFAKNQKGDFILRIEDTDQTRYSAEAEENLKSELKWLGMDWDEGPGKGGNFGPYKQSERLDLYRKYAEQLVKEEKAYHCFCTAQRLEEVRAKQKESKFQTTGYDRHCRNLPEAERKTLLENNTPYVIRLKIPETGTTSFDDLLRGPIQYQNEVLDDIVLYKSNGFPSYHLANVVDDHLMEISHVMRGEEWIPSSPKHQLLYNAFGWTPPVFVHLPVILAEGGGKLSKRKGAASVADFKNLGYLPEALNNFLALLGWSPGDDREYMSQEEMVASFSLQKINPKSCFFDTQKLEWMNGQHIQHLSDEAMGKLLEASLPENLDKKWGQTYYSSVGALLKERVKKTTEIYEMARYFFEEPTAYEEKAFKKRVKENTPQHLKMLSSELKGLESFSAENIEKLYHQLKEDWELPGAGALIHPTRLGISGVSFGPGLFQMMEVLGKEKVIGRLEMFAQYIEASQKSGQQV